jgi:hypothetical protein
MTDTIECEYKYKADGIKLSDFEAIFLPLKPKVLRVGGWDYYMVKENSPDEFQRYRESEKPELTKKVKTKDSNNWKRIESDLALCRERTTFEMVAFHVGLDGYKFNFKIYKNCVIFFLEDINAVYYTTYDENMKENGRYIEIECNKDRVEALGDKVMDVLKEWEAKLSQIGITPQNRMKRSLFEIYRK